MDDLVKGWALPQEMLLLLLCLFVVGLLDEEVPLEELDEED